MRSQGVPYFVGPESYLRRARQRLDEARHDSLFYAAFELRCGIEARMHECLEAQADVSRKKKHGWKIAVLGKEIERAFRTGDRVVEITLDGLDGRPPIVLYYTPVTSKLRGMAERLGGLLHAMKSYKDDGDEWWNETRNYLEGVYDELRDATSGTVLAPPLLWKKTRITMQIKARDSDPNGGITGLGEVGGRLSIRVRYLDRLPSHAPETA